MLSSTEPNAASKALCLVARGVTVSFGSRQVLADVDLSVRAGEIAVIEGPSGSGKSTLLRALASLEAIVRGEVVLDGQPASELTPEAFRVRVAYVAQLPVMFAGSVLDNVCAGPRLRGVELSSERAIALLDRAALDASYASREATSLSGGEKQRVAIARALANEPRAMLFDEPTSALDPESAGAIVSLLQRCAADGCAVIVVTHAREHAEALAGTRYVCRDGSVRPWEAT